ncbi:MAG: hypothetical protein HY083_06460 [Gammaproteobacteria bacterium]|nr:hypothetical protein [Gammaproteobacteria bacterium]
MKTNLKMLWVAALFSLVSGGSLAGSVAPLTTFTAGTTAQASQVNGNFNAVSTAVNDNNARITTNTTNITANTTAISTKQDRVTGTCATSSAIRTINADGTVVCESTTSATTGYVTVSAVGAIPRNSTYETTQTNAGGSVGRNGVTTGQEFLVVPVNLPHGATITKFTYVCYDNDATYSSSGYLYRDTNTAIATVSTGGASTTLQTLSTTSISGPTVNNQTSGIYVYMGVQGEAGANLAPVRAIIEYTLP